jgi:hypothetical protein
VALGEIDRELDQVGHPRRVGRGDARQVRRHVREDDVDRPAADARLELGQDRASRKSPAMKSTPSIGSNSSMSRATMVPCSGPGRLRVGARAATELAPDVLAPGPGTAPRSTTNWPGSSRCSCSSISFSLYAARAR